MAERLPGFADVDYRDWRGLLGRLVRGARLADWRGPIIFDELPYLVLASPELPSILQRWVDHEAREARLVVAIAGSSQRMMQGFVLSGDAPLFGRAREVLRLGPIPPTYLGEAFPWARSADVVEPGHVDVPTSLERLLEWARAVRDPARLDRAAHELARKPVPLLGKAYDRHQLKRTLFVPRTTGDSRPPEGVDLVVTAADLLSLA